MSILERFLVWLGRSDRMGPRCGRDTGDLARDTSGAIMIAGTFMAALMAAGVFFIISTGDAIVYRERLQDAADAVAFTSAGVHARGMNIIVVINLIMAALLAILILMRLIILLLGIAIVACGICMAATIFCPMSPICAAAMNFMVKAEQQLIKGADNYEDALGWILPVLSKLEVVVALTTPYVGAYKGNKVGKYYQPLEKTGLAVSPSMVPFVPSTKKLGLPVQEMKWDDFCKKAATIGLEKGLGAFLPDFVMKPISWIAGGLVKAFSGYFCGGDGGTFQNIMDNKINEQAKDGCEKQKDSCKGLKEETPPPTCTGNYDQDQNGGKGCVSKHCTDMGSFGFDFNNANCMKEGKDAAAKAQKDSGYKGGGQNGLDGGSGGVLDFKNKTPKEIWDGASHGSIWFQTFGVVTGDSQFPRRNDRGIALATKSGQLPKVDTTWGNWRIAQAEFYFDDKGKWGDLKEDCMWKMYWRARLRRFTISGINLSQWGLGQLFDVIKKYSGADEWLSKVIQGGSSVGGSALEAAIYQTIEDKLKDFVKDWGKGLDSAIDSWAMPSWEIIH